MSLDPFYIAPLTNALAGSIYGYINRVTIGKTPRAAQTLNTAVKNLVLFCVGTSNDANVDPSAYAAVNTSALDNFNVEDGTIYPAVDPQLGTTLVVASSVGVGCPALRIADVLVNTGKFARVVIVPLGIGASTSAEWATGRFSTRLPIAIGRLAARGIVEGTNVTFTSLCGLGELDHGVAQATFQANVGTLITASRTAGMASGLWLIAKKTYLSGSADATIQAAQAALVNHGAGIWAGPDADALIGNTCSGSACRQADNTHWSTNGSLSYASAWLTALAATGAPF